MKTKRVIANFWKLYGAGVVHKNITGFRPMDAKQWKLVRSLALRNKLSGIILDGIAYVPKEAKPDKQFIEQWAFSEIQNFNRHRELNQVIAELVNRWRKAGTRPVLLKGQSFARMYPNPLLRTTGDIDIFVCEAEWDKAMSVVNTLQLDEQRMPDIGKHIEFFYRRKSVELHRRSAELFHRMDLDPAYQEWSEAILPVSESGFYINESGEYADSGTWISTPPATFYAFYTFMHLWGHMYWWELESIHIRAVADWVLFLRTHRNEIDITELEHRLQQFDLMRYWQLFGCFAVRYMDIAPADIPFYNPKKMRKAARLHSFVKTFMLGHVKDNKGKSLFAIKMHKMLLFMRLWCLSMLIIDYKKGLKKLAEILQLSAKWLFVYYPSKIFKR